LGGEKMVILHRVYRYNSDFFKAPRVLITNLRGRRGDIVGRLQEDIVDFKDTIRWYGEGPDRFEYETIEYAKKGWIVFFPADSDLKPGQTVILTAFKCLNGKCLKAVEWYSLQEFEKLERKRLLQKAVNVIAQQLLSSGVKVTPEQIFSMFDNKQFPYPYAKVAENDKYIRCLIFIDDKVYDIKAYYNGYGSVSRLSNVMRFAEFAELLGTYVCGSCPIYSEKVRIFPKYNHLYFEFRGKEFPAFIEDFHCNCEMLKKHFKNLCKESISSTSPSPLIGGVGFGADD